MKARDMFEELGYIVVEDANENGRTSIWYQKNNGFSITEVHFDDNSVYFISYVDGLSEEKILPVLSYKELKAIKKQMEEILGWGETE